MEKCHTIVAFFSIAEGGERNECCVLNFAETETAKAAFREKLNECGNGDVVENQDGEEMDAGALYEFLLGTGTYFDAADGTRFFVRAERVYKDFGEGTRETTAWN